MPISPAKLVEAAIPWRPSPLFQSIPGLSLTPRPNQARRIDTEGLSEEEGGDCVRENGYQKYIICTNRLLSSTNYYLRWT